MYKTVTEYPENAIRDEETIRILIDLAVATGAELVLFDVGSYSHFSQYLMDKDTDLREASFGSLFLTKIRYQDMPEVSTERSLMNMNIPFNGYNDHFLFIHEESAKAYSEFLKNSEEHLLAVAKHHKWCEEPQVITEENMLHALKEYLPQEPEVDDGSRLNQLLDKYQPKIWTFYNEQKPNELAVRRIEEINVSIPALNIEFRQVNVLID